MDPAAKAFLQPKTPKHRKYEALRACLVEGISVPEAAGRFGYTPGTLHVMCSKFRKAPSIDFLFPSSDAKAPSQKGIPHAVKLI